MDRSILLACLPWMAILIASIAVLCLLARANRARLKPRRLLRLHADQRGAVQSLSFVITLPLFIMVLLLIVQVSQLMIGQIAVEYAAFAAARAAAVWIPADLSWTDSNEGPNCISSFYVDPDAPDQVFPILNPDDPDYGPAEGGMTYRIEPGGAKYGKIAAAAVLAVMPIAPSRESGATLSAADQNTADIIAKTYAAMAPGSDSGAAVPRRVANKLAYAAANTAVEIRFYHKNTEPPLGVTYWIPPDTDEFRFNQIGWQDQITVTVRHNLALLPGPGRLLFRSGAAGIEGRRTDANVYRDIYTYPLAASATIGNEGEKPAIPYVYQTY